MEDRVVNPKGLESSIYAYKDDDSDWDWKQCIISLATMALSTLSLLDELWDKGKSERWGAFACLAQVFSFAEQRFAIDLGFGFILNFQQVIDIVVHVGETSL